MKRAYPMNFEASFLRIAKKAEKRNREKRLIANVIGEALPVHAKIDHPNRGFQSRVGRWVKKYGG